MEGKDRKRMTISNHLTIKNDEERLHLLHSHLHHIDTIGIHWKTFQVGGNKWIMIANPDFDG